MSVPGLSNIDSLRALCHDELWLLDILESLSSCLRYEILVIAYTRRISVTKHLLEQADNQLPPDTAWLFPEYDFDEMDLEHHRGVIIERILERGTWEQLSWLFATYGEAGVATWVRRHGFRLLSKRSFALWRLALGVVDYEAPEWAVAAKEMETW